MRLIETVAGKLFHEVEDGARPRGRNASCLRTCLENRALFVFVGYSTPTLLLAPGVAGYQLGPFDFDASLPAQDFTALGWQAAEAD